MYPVAEALRSDSEVAELDLGFNAIADPGAASLARLVEQSLSLRSLNLEANSIGKDGAEALAKVHTAADCCVLNYS